ncbi:hypothetical protein FKP32DRAFT_1605747 [Trametes sanguinea]|nr:hypothetical protein FKP32DRAFT_1605747 [Trametes sanguinea]
MIEPTAPITIRVLPSSYPAFLLPSEDDVEFKPSSAFLRYRHLRQQQKVIRGSLVESMSSGKRSMQLKTTPGINVSGGHTLAITPDGADRLTNSAQASPISTPSFPAVDATSRSSARHLRVESASPERVAGPSHSSSISAVERVAGPSHSGRIPTIRFAPKPAQGDRGSAGIGTDIPGYAASARVSEDVVSLEVSTHTHDHAIRGRSEKIVWFSSASDTPLQAPPSVPTPHYGDLYVHSVIDGSVQVWLRTEAGTWASIDMFHPHPYLRGHVLNILQNREPRWVTKDTARTYKARAKKRARGISVPMFPKMRKVIKVYSEVIAMLA